MVDGFDEAVEDGGCCAELPADFHMLMNLCMAWNLNHCGKRGDDTRLSLNLDLGRKSASPRKKGGRGGGGGGGEEGGREERRKRTGWKGGRRKKDDFAAVFSSAWRIYICFNTSAPDFVLAGPRPLADAKSHRISRAAEFAAVART
jgi:hypothetical protein